MTIQDFELTDVYLRSRVSHLRSQLRAIETTDLEKRLAKLETEDQDKENVNDRRRHLKGPGGR